MRLYSVGVSPVYSLKVRALRKEAHKYFNQIYDRAIMSRQEAYQWLSEYLGLPQERTHIGMMGEYYCQMVIDGSKMLLSRYSGSQPHRPKSNGGDFNAA